MTQKKTHKVYILLGEMAVDTFQNEGVKCLIDQFDEVGGDVRCREFETEKEATAYCLGLDDALGWEDYILISKNSYDKIVKQYEEG